MELKTGDIIRLDNNINDEHVVKVSNIKFFAGRGGITNNHKAIKITKMLFGGKK
jgi:flagellar motor switch protein FliM